MSSTYLLFMERLRRKDESATNGDALRLVLRTVIGENERIHDVNYFDDLRQSVRKIQATHYSPVKVSKTNFGEIPLLLHDQKNTEDTKKEKIEKVEDEPKRRETKGNRRIPKVPNFETKSRGSVSTAEERPSQARESYSPLVPLQPKEATTRTHLLVDKISTQSDRIDQLEAELQRLKGVNQRLEEANQLAHRNLAVQREQMQEQLARAHLANLEHMVHGDRDEEVLGSSNDRIDNDFRQRTSHRTSHSNCLRSHDHLSHPSSATSRHASPLSRSPASEPVLPPLLAAQAALYKSRYEQTARRLDASIRVSEFQARAIRKLVNVYPSDDSTTQLILGTTSDSTSAFLGGSYPDSTTALIRGPRNVYDELFPKRRTPLATLKAAIWAVMFTIRLRRLVSEGPGITSDITSVDYFDIH